MFGRPYNLFLQHALYRALPHREGGGVPRDIATDTYDREGERTSEPVDPRFKRDELEAVLMKFRGAFLQTPPPFSAKKVSGTPVRPRLVVTRSSRHMVAQIVDDVARVTLASASTLEAGLRSADGDKTAKAKEVGKLVAERAKAKGVGAVVFDRGGNQYHGRVAAVADGAREAGLEL